MADAAQIFAVYSHGSNERLDYSIDWSRQLQADDLDTIASSAWVVEAGSPTLGNGSNGAPSPSVASGVASVWVIGGTAGTEYVLSNRVTTAAGRIHERSVKIRVVDK